MKKISINSYAKVNLSLDVLRKLPNGYHQLETVMQQIDLHDDISVKWITEQESKNGKIEIELKTNRYYLPVDERNIAYKAAMLMAERYSKGKTGVIKIDILKRIPVAAGLAGGSGNGAAVIHALNKLWELELTLEELCTLGAELGSDVPFCVIGQARCNDVLDEKIRNDKLASSAALATGTGTVLTPVTPLEGYIVVTKPPISVSTKTVYDSIKISEIEMGPNTRELIEALEEKNTLNVIKNMINVLEFFTLKLYPSVMYTKNIASTQDSALAVLMSGSGPSIIAFFQDKSKALKAYENLLIENKETFLTQTTI